jgi:TPR repeat protein
VIGPAQSGNAHAQFIAGMVANNKGRTAEARQWWQKSMAQGYPESYTALGYLALGGRAGEARSSANAASLFGQGAERGSAQGMLNLSRLLMLGDGIPMDRARAAQWRTRAAAAKDPTAIGLVNGAANRDGPAMVDAAMWLGNFGRADDGVRLLANEARAGNVTAMVVLGKVYYNGQAGGGRNYELARQWWEKAGDNPAALYYLGVLYMYGRGVHTNWGRAEGYFSAAAKRGHPDGARMAATMRDIHVPPVMNDGQRDFEQFCSSKGGTAIGVACYRGGETVLVK